MDKTNNICITILGITLALILTTSSISVSFGSFVGSPNYQLESGIAPEDVVCKKNYVLILKPTSKLPACVTSETGKKLMERNWLLVETITNIDSQTTDENNSILNEILIPLERGPGPRTLALHGQPVDLTTAQNISTTFAENPLSTYSLTDIHKSYQIPNAIPVNLELKLVLQNYPGQSIEQSTTMIFVPSDVEIDENQILGYPFLHGGIKLFVDHYYSLDPNYDFDTNFQVLLQTPGAYELESFGLPILVIEEPNSTKPLISVKIFDESIHTQIILYSYDHSAEELIDLGLSTYWG